MFDNEILARLKMLDEGIVPYGSHGRIDEIRSGLESLNADERRAASRKFRKLWRKACKKADKDCSLKERKSTYLEQCASANARPPGYKRNRRAAVVLKMFLE